MTARDSTSAKSSTKAWDSPTSAAEQRPSVPRSALYPLQAKALAPRSLYHFKNPINMKISIGLADDHQLFLSSLSLLVDNLPEFQIVLQALNGKECLQKISALPTPPDILILDDKMPVMDGCQTAKTISSEYPGIKIVALSMKSDDYSIINMLKAGCCAYLLIDIHPNELEQALIQINQHGYYNADAANINYRRLIRHQ